MLSFTLTLVETTPPLTGAVSGGNDTKESPLKYFLCIKGFVYRNLVYQSLCRGGSETLSDHPPGCVLQKAAFSLQCHTETNRPKSMGLLLRMG